MSRERVRYLGSVLLLALIWSSLSSEPFWAFIRIMIIFGVIAGVIFGIGKFKPNWLKAIRRYYSIW